jgi:hypothetical protein
MKNLAFLPIALSVLFLFSCKKESSREDYLGTYQCAEHSISPYGFEQDYVYTMNIVAAAADNQVILHDLNDGEIEVRAAINGNSLEFIDPYSDSEIVGTGTLDGNILKLEYKVDQYFYSGGPMGKYYYLTTTCTKQ